MKLNTNNVDKFMKVVNSCLGPVYLTDWRVDKNDEPNFQLNLKSKFRCLLVFLNFLESMAIGLKSMLLSVKMKQRL